MGYKAIQKKREERTKTVAAYEAFLAAAKPFNGALGNVDQATQKLSATKVEACKRGPMP